MTTPSAHARAQYAATTGNLSARIAIYDYRTNPQDWYSWVGERLPLAGRVVEAGAGTGALWGRVEAPAGLTLVDFSPAMCAGLRAAVPGARVVQASAGDLPFADGSFDGLIANHMLYHLDDPVAGLREFARVLRGGGRLAVSVNGRDHLAEIDALLPKRSALNGVNAENIAAYVGEVFDDVEVQRYPCELAIPDAEPVLRYLASRNPAALTADVTARVREVVAAHGVFRVRQHSVVVTATARASAVVGPAGHDDRVG